MFKICKKHALDVIYNTYTYCTAYIHMVFFLFLRKQKIRSGKECQLKSPYTIHNKKFSLEKGTNYISNIFW